MTSEDDGQQYDTLTRLPDSGLAVLLLAACATASAHPSPVAITSPTVTSSIVPSPSSRLTPSPTAPASTPAPYKGFTETIYLTFGDGPNPTWTPEILSLLESSGAHASFFTGSCPVPGSDALIAKPTCKARDGVPQPNAYPGQLPQCRARVGVTVDPEVENTADVAIARQRGEHPHFNRRALQRSAITHDYRCPVDERGGFFALEAQAVHQQAPEGMEGRVTRTASAYRIPEPGGIGCEVTGVFINPFPARRIRALTASR
jgi:hypothetical protein